MLFSDIGQQHETDTISVRLVSDMGQHEGTATVIQLSRPVPVIKRACSPPLLELHPPPPPVLDEAHGVHFLTPGETSLSDDTCHGDDNQQPRTKSELLEYLIRSDGSVTCKLCGEILASRTHWYRHKYKLHGTNVSVQPTLNSGASSSTATCISSATVHPQPSPLYKCELCSVFFKSKKGYMGHISARHSSTTSEEENVNIEEVQPVSEITEKTRRREPSGNTSSSLSKDIWEKQREKEEKLVADIIDRVRRECEAQGAIVSRRGYSRRSTVMNTCN